MSLSNLLKDNNYDLYCNEINANFQNIDTVVVDNITINNAVVLGTVTTPHITSGTSLFNTIDTLTINAQTANIGTITSSTASLDTISGTNLTYTNGNIDQLNGSNVQYGTGNITDITGSNLTYDTGYIPSLSTKELTITSAILSCPNANIDNLTINSTFTAPLFEAPDMHVDYIRSYSVGKTTFQENVVVDTQFNCPLVSTDVIQTNGSGNIALNNPVLGSDISLSSALTAPTVRVNALSTTTGSGTITSSNALAAPSITLSTITAVPSTPLNFYYFDSASTVVVSGAVNTINVTYKVVRIGNSVSFQLNSFPATVCTNNTLPITVTLPSILQPGSICRGLVAILNGGVSTLGRWNLTGTTLTINSGLLPTDFWTLGNVCSIAGGTWNFQWII